MPVKKADEDDEDIEPANAPEPVFDEKELVRNVMESVQYFGNSKFTS